MENITTESVSNKVYVIENLAIEYRQKYKYYSSFFEATEDLTGDATFVIIGHHTLNATYRTGINVVVSSGSTLEFRHNLSAYYAVHNNWNIYCEAGASIILDNQGQFKNLNIYGKPTFTLRAGTNWDIYVDANTYSLIDIGTWYSYALLHVDEIFGYLVLNADNVFKMGSVENFIGLQMQTAPDRILVRAGYSTSGILFESGAYSPAYATVHDSFIKVDNSTGCIAIFENNESPNLKVINSRLINTNDVSTACGINNYLGNGNVVNIILTNTVIETSHTSSKSIKVDSANGNTGVITGINSWSNKALGADITQTITDGFTVDTNVKA